MEKGEFGAISPLSSPFYIFSQKTPIKSNFLEILKTLVNQWFCKVFIL